MPPPEATGSGTPVDMYASRTGCFSGMAMSETNAIDSLGSRILSAARMAVALHLSLDNPRDGEQMLQQKAMIGGTDRRVTEDSLSLSVVSGPLSVVKQSNN
jgi:hypothetical protein